MFFKNSGRSGVAWVDEACATLGSDCMDHGHGWECLLKLTSVSVCGVEHSENTIPIVSASGRRFLTVASEPIAIGSSD